MLLLLLLMWLLLLVWPIKCAADAAPASEPPNADLNVPLLLLLPLLPGRSPDSSFCCSDAILLLMPPTPSWLSLLLLLLSF
jgi:hypothetical protein